MPNLHDIYDETCEYLKKKTFKRNLNVVGIYITRKETRPKQTVLNRNPENIYLINIT